MGLLASLECRSEEISEGGINNKWPKGNDTKLALRRLPFLAAFVTPSTHFQLLISHHLVLQFPHATQRCTDITCADGTWKL